MKVGNQDFAREVCLIIGFCPVFLGNSPFSLIFGSVFLFWSSNNRITISCKVFLCNIFKFFLWSHYRLTGAYDIIMANKEKSSDFYLFLNQTKLSED